MIINEKYLTRIDLFYKLDWFDITRDCYIDKDGMFVYEYEQYSDDDKVDIVTKFDTSIQIINHCCEGDIYNATQKQLYTIYDVIKNYRNIVWIKTPYNFIKIEFEAPSTFASFVKIINDNKHENIKIEKDYVTYIKQSDILYDVYKKRLSLDDFLLNPLDESKGLIEYFDDYFDEVEKLIYDSHIYNPTNIQNIFLTIQKNNEYIIDSGLVYKYNRFAENKYEIDRTINHISNGVVDSGYHRILFNMQLKQRLFKLGVVNRNNPSPNDDIIILFNIQYMFLKRSEFKSVLSHELTHIAAEWSGDKNPLNTTKSNIGRYIPLTVTELYKKWRTFFYFLSPHERNAFISQLGRHIIDEITDEEFENIRNKPYNEICTTMTEQSRYKNMCLFTNMIKELDDYKNREKEIETLYIGMVMSNHKLINYHKSYLTDDYIDKLLNDDSIEISQTDVYYFRCHITKKFDHIVDDYKKQLERIVRYSISKRLEKQK